MKNKLAFVGEITEIHPIRKADFIVSTTVDCGIGGKWMGTVRKNQFQVGDLVEVYLQDAIVPEIPEFAFMEQHRFRISMRKFKLVPSECLIMPMSNDVRMTDPVVGADISSIKDVKKYIKQLPADLAGKVLGMFPSALIPKTDEPNFQTAEQMIESLQGQRYYSTVKCDGSSGTIYKMNDHFGCCGRSLEFKPSKTNVFWRIAKEYGLIYSMPAGYAIQFEACGPGIQKNRLALDKIEPRVFNVWDIKKRKYLDAEDAFQFAKKLNIPTVDVIAWDEVFNIKDSDTLRKMAEGKYSSNRQREGIVIRPMIEQFEPGLRERLSFKIINLLFEG